MNTGLTLRTIRVKDGLAEVRAGATLLYDSDPVAEEAETELKASAMLTAIDEARDETEEAEVATLTTTKGPGEGKSIVIVDHEDSFVHTLGNYLRQTGAEVTTLRSGPSALRSIQRLVDEGKKPDMVVLSPGPGNPTDFELSKTISLLQENQIPGFGVCLGLQGMVEHFGGELGVLKYPMHGKPSPVALTESGKKTDSIFNGLPETFEVARYHSLYGLRDKLPSCLDITALSEDGIVMAIKHKTLPYAAVQFHPESILTSPAHGMTILMNALSFLSYEGETTETTAAYDHVDEVVNELDDLPFSELKSMLKERGMSVHGTKSELVTKLALRQLKAEELAADQFDLAMLTVPELRELKTTLGVKGTTTTKSEMIRLLTDCLAK